MSKVGARVATGGEVLRRRSPSGSRDEIASSTLNQIISKVRVLDKFQTAKLHVVMPIFCFNFEQMAFSQFHFPVQNIHQRSTASFK